MKKKYITPKTAPSLQTENALLSEGRLVCRGGLSPVGEPLFTKDGSYPGQTDFLLTDCYLRRGLKVGRVAVVREDNLSDSLLLTFMLIFVGGGRESLGRVAFTRTSADSFGRPESFTLFSGAPIKGDGIFLVCRQVYGGDTEDFISVREFSFESEGWNLLSDSDFYAPLLLSYGRGNSYFLAADTEYKVSFPSPTYPETENLLSGVFRAEFSSDGASSDFELPLSGLSDDRITAHFSYMGEEVDWQIPAGSEYSDTVSFIGNRVVMVCDRTEGRISFKEEGGGDFSLPYWGRANNLKVTAVKKDPESAVLVASMSAGLPVGGGVSEELLGTTFFYKSRLHPSVGLFNHPSHPLYFPKVCRTDVGAALSDALTTANSLVIFSPEAIYSAERKASPFVAKDLKKVCDLTLPLLPGSVASTGDGICFLSRSGEFYSLKGGRLSLVSRLSQTPTPGGFALFFGGIYLYLSGKDGHVCQPGEPPICGKWTFPLPIVGGFAFGGELALLPAFTDYDRAVIFSAVLSGQEDEVLLFSGSQILPSAHGIAAKCRFAFSEPTPTPIRLCRLRADGKGDALLAVKDGKKTLLRRRGELHRGKIFSAGCAALAPEIELRFSSDGSFNGLAAEYYEL